MGIRHVADIRKNYSAGVELFEPHFPADLRQELRRAARDAARALEDYGEWIERNIDEMHGDPNVGQENMLWFFKRVNFVPWTREELLSLGEHEKNRFLMSIEIEETKNEGSERPDDADHRGVDRMVPSHILADEVLAQGQRPHQLPRLHW